MKHFFRGIKSSILNELPVIKLYYFLYLVGIFTGVVTSVLLRNDFSGNLELLFRQFSGSGYFQLLFHQLTAFFFLFLFGLAVVGLLMVVLFPVYKGFSLGLLISLSVILFGLKGLLLGIPAFMVQNLLYTCLGYFSCVSSARLSVCLIDLLKGRSKHGAPYREFLRHLKYFLISLPFLSIICLWEWKAVPIFLSLF